jgi:hypothetical protein
MERTKSIKEIESERDLCKRLDLPTRGESGKPRQPKNWIRGGLQELLRSPENGISLRKLWLIIC